MNFFKPSTKNISLNVGFGSVIRKYFSLAPNPVNRSEKKDFWKNEEKKLSTAYSFPLHIKRRMMRGESLTSNEAMTS